MNFIKHISQTIQVLFLERVVYSCDFWVGICVGASLYWVFLT
jgi:hypothetical protein